MKQSRFICSFLVFTFYVASVHAQPQIGLAAGANFASLNNFGGTSHTGLHAGVYVKTRINKTWSLQPELIFSGEGTRYNVEGADRTLALNFVSIPVLFQYQTGKLIRLEAGPQLGFLVNAVDKGTEGDHLNVKRSFRNSEFGFDLGIGFHLSEAWSITGRYTFNLTDITLFDNTINQSRVFGIGVDYMPGRSKNK